MHLGHSLDLYSFSSPTFSLIINLILRQNHHPHKIRNTSLSSISSCKDQWCSMYIDNNDTQPSITASNTSNVYQHVLTHVSIYDCGRRVKIPGQQNRKVSHVIEVKQKKEHTLHSPLDPWPEIQQNTKDSWRGSSSTFPESPNTEVMFISYFVKDFHASLKFSWNKSFA